MTARVEKRGVNGRPPTKKKPGEKPLDFPPAAIVSQGEQKLRKAGEKKKKKIHEETRRLEPRARLPRPPKGGRLGKGHRGAHQAVQKKKTAEHVLQTKRSPARRGGKRKGSVVFTLAQAVASGGNIQKLRGLIQRKPQDSTGRASRIRRTINEEGQQFNQYKKWLPCVPRTTLSKERTNSTRESKETIR